MYFSQFLCILEKFLNCLLPQLVKQTFQHMEIQMVRKERDLTQWTKISFQLLIECIIFPSARSVCHCLTLIQEQEISSLLNNKKRVNNNNEYNWQYIVSYFFVFISNLVYFKISKQYRNSSHTQFGYILYKVFKTVSYRLYNYFNICPNNGIVYCAKSQRRI